MLRCDAPPYPAGTVSVSLSVHGVKISSNDSPWGNLVLTYVDAPMVDLVKLKKYLRK